MYSLALLKGKLCTCKVYYSHTSHMIVYMDVPLIRILTAFYKSVFRRALWSRSSSSSDFAMVSPNDIDNPQDCKYTCNTT